MENKAQMRQDEAFSLTQHLNVSRETLTKLWRFCQLVLEWNHGFNLVSRQMTLRQLWQEHLLDSLQLMDYLPSGGDADFAKQLAMTQERILDIGSGAGFPGMVLAILGYPCVLVERNLKKAVFLREAARMMEVHCQILNCDIRAVSAMEIGEIKYIVSRAVTSIQGILDLSMHLIANDTKVLLLKSKRQTVELQELSCGWRFKLQEHSNKYKSEGMVVVISELVKIDSDR